MGTEFTHMDLVGLTLERCDELEEAAVKLAREISHLKSMIHLSMNQPTTMNDGQVPDAVAESVAN